LPLGRSPCHSAVAVLIAIVSSCGSVRLRIRIVARATAPVQGEGVPRFKPGAERGRVVGMLRSRLLATALAALLLGVAVPAPAGAVPVPMGACAPAAPGGSPCVQPGAQGGDALTAVARSGMRVVVTVWQTSAFVLF
jgi:hypothetical protein